MGGSKDTSFCIWIISIVSFYSLFIDASVIFLSRPDKPKIIPDTGKTWFDKDKSSFSFDGPAVGRPFLPDQESPYKIFDSVAELSPFNVFNHHPTSSSSSSNKNDVGKAPDARLTQTLDGDTYYGIRAHDLIESPEKVTDQSEDLDSKGAIVPPGEANGSIPRREEDAHSLESPNFSSTHDLFPHHEFTVDKDEPSRTAVEGPPIIESGAAKSNLDKLDEDEQHDDTGKTKTDTIISQGHQLPRIVNQKPPPIHVTESNPTELDREAEKPTSAMVQNDAPPNDTPAFSVNDVINSEKAAMSFAKQFGDVFPEDKNGESIPSDEGADHEKRKSGAHALESHNTQPKSVPPTASHDMGHDTQQPMMIHPNTMSHLVKHINSKHSTSPSQPKDNKKHHHVTIDTDTGEIVNEAVVTVPEKMHKQVKNDIEKLDPEKSTVKHESSGSSDDGQVDPDLQAAELLGGGLQENEKQRDLDKEIHKSYSDNNPSHENHEPHERIDNIENTHFHGHRDFHDPRYNSRPERFFPQERRIGGRDFHDFRNEDISGENRHIKGNHVDHENRNHHSRMLSEETLSGAMMHDGDNHRVEETHENENNRPEAFSHEPSHERDAQPPETSHLVSHYDYHDMHGPNNEHRDEQIDPETSFDHHNHDDGHRDMSHESNDVHEPPHESRDDTHENVETHDTRDHDSREDAEEIHDQEDNDPSDEDSEGNPRQNFHAHESTKEVTYLQNQPNKESIKFAHRQPESEDIPEMSRGKAGEKKKPDFGDFDKAFPPPKSGLRNKHRKPEEEHHDDLLLHHDSALNIHLDKEHDKDPHHDDHDEHDDEEDEHDADIDHDEDADEHEYTKEDPEEEHEEIIHRGSRISGPQTHYHKHIHHHNHIHIHSPTDHRIVKNGFRHMDPTLSNAIENIHNPHGHHPAPRGRPDVPPFTPRSEEFQPEDDIQKQLLVNQASLLGPTHQYAPLYGRYSPSPIPPEESAPLRTEALQPIPNVNQNENEKSEDEASESMIKPENGMKSPEETPRPSEKLGEPSNKSAMKDDDDAQYGSDYYHMVEGVKKMKKVGRFLSSSDTTQDHIHENEVFDNNNLTNDIVLSKDGSSKRHHKRLKKPSFAMEPKIESQHEVVEPGYMVHEDPRGDGLGAGVIDGPEIGSPVSSPPDTGSSSKREQLNVTGDIHKEDSKIFDKKPNEEDDSSKHDETQHLVSYPPGETFKVYSEKNSENTEHKDDEKSNERESSKQIETRTEEKSRKSHSNAESEMSSLLHSNVLQKFASHIIRNQSMDERADVKNRDDDQQKKKDEHQRKAFDKLDEMHLNGLRHSDEESEKDSKYNMNQRNEERRKENHFPDEEHQRELKHTGEENMRELKTTEGENIQERRPSEIQDNYHLYPHERELKYGTPQKSRLFSSIQEHLQNIEVDDLNKLQEEIKAIKSKKMYKAKTVSAVSRSPQKVHLNLDVRSNKYKIPERQFTLPLQNPGHPDDMNGVIDTSAIKSAKKMPLLNPSPVADLEEDAASKKHTLTAKRGQAQKGSPKNIIAHTSGTRDEGHDEYGMVTLHGSETEEDLQPFVIASKYKVPSRHKNRKPFTKKFVNTKGDTRSLVRKLNENSKSIESKITQLLDKKGLSHLEESPLVIGEHHKSTSVGVESNTDKPVISKKSFFERPFKSREEIETDKTKEMKKLSSSKNSSNSSTVDTADIPKIRKRVLSFKRSAEKLDIK